MNVFQMLEQWKRRILNTRPDSFGLTSLYGITPVDLFAIDNPTMKTLVKGKSNAEAMGEILDLPYNLVMQVIAAHHYPAHVTITPEMVAESVQDLIDFLTPPELPEPAEEVDPLSNFKKGVLGQPNERIVKRWAKLLNTYVGNHKSKATRVSDALYQVDVKEFADMYKHICMPSVAAHIQQNTDWSRVYFSKGGRVITFS